MSKPECICDFELRCFGSGFLTCIGCGGDQCVCEACGTGGEMECPGCDDCPMDENAEDSDG